MPRIDSLFRFVGNWIKDTCKGFTVGETTVTPDLDNGNTIGLIGSDGISISSSGSDITVALQDGTHIESIVLRSRGFWTHPTSSNLTANSFLEFIVGVIPKNETGHDILYRVTAQGTFAAQTTGTLHQISIYYDNAHHSRLFNSLDTQNADVMHTTAFIYMANGAAAKNIYMMAQTSSNGSISDGTLLFEPVAWL